MTATNAEFWSVSGLLLPLAESSLARALLIGVLAVFLSPAVAAWVRQRQPAHRKFALIATVAPFFAPELIVGYCYSTGVFSLVHLPLMNCGLYALLLLLKTLPVGVLAVLYSPGSPVSPVGYHCFRMLPRDRRSWRAMIEFWLRGPLCQCLPVFSVSFLIAYQEFEIASLMSVPSWTVDLFDAQAKAIQPLDTLRLLLFPLAMISLAVLPVVALLSRSSSEPLQTAASATPRACWPGGVMVAVGNLLLWGLPLLTIGEDGLRNFNALARNTVVFRGFARETGYALAFAFCAALSTVVAARILLRVMQTRWRAGRMCLSVTLLPGLAGALAVSLLFFVLIQQAPLIGLRSTPVPAVAGLTVFLLPRAVLMLVLFQTQRRSTATGSAELLSQSRETFQAASGFRLLWQLEDRALFWTFSAVFFWGFFNLTAASLLMPLAIVPLPAQLYNLMHYGRTMSLSTQAILSVLVPVTLIALSAWLLPRVERLLSPREEPTSVS